MFINLGPDRGAVPQGDKQYYTGKGYTSKCLMSILLAKVDGNYIKKIYETSEDEIENTNFLEFEYYLNEKYEICNIEDGIFEIIEEADLNKEYLCIKVNYCESPLSDDISNVGIEYVLPNLEFLKDFEVHTAESLNDFCLTFNQNELFLCVGVHYSTDYWGETDVDYDIIGYLNADKELVKI